MLFSYNWFQQYIKEKLPKPEKLADLLSMHSFEVEDLRKLKTQNSKLKTDWIFDIAVLPNRAHDCLCHLGIAREIAAFGKFKLQPPKAKNIQTQKGSLASLKVRIQNSELVARYSALVVEGVTIGKSPPWLQDKLQAVGIHTINNVVDLTNYVMLEMGQPLHAFDYDQISGARMHVREAKEGEKLETLDDKTLTLPKGALVIEDAKRFIDLAGIKGGKMSGISKNTKNIILQAANFDAPLIYNTKKRLRYRTLAADIYAHQIDPNLTMEALERVYQLLDECKIGGKTVQSVDIYPKKILPKNISLDMLFLQSMLGAAIPKIEAKKILKSLGCSIKERGNAWQVEIPTRRIDLTIPEDLTEEIGRIHGYESIPSDFPVASLTLPPRNHELLWEEKIRDVFTSLGFTEVYNYSFIGRKDLPQFAYSNKDQAKLIALENPVSEDFAYLRDSLLENLLKNMRDNQKMIEVIRIFEIGKIFQRDKQKLQETKMLGALISDGNFYEMNGICDFLLNSLGITDIWYDEYQPTPDKGRETLWHKGKSAELKVGNTEIGFIGEISAETRDNLKIAKPVVAAHLNLEKLILLATEEKEYQAPSKFPASTRDIAMLVPISTKVADVMNVLYNAGGELVEDIDLFDVYEGEEIEQNRKNFAFHIVYQADDRTLTSKEIDALHEKIIKAVEQNPEWEVRK